MDAEKQARQVADRFQHLEKEVQDLRLLIASLVEALMDRNSLPILDGPRWEKYQEILKSRVESRGQLNGPVL
jgi:hypothetical protein